MSLILCINNIYCYFLHILVLLTAWFLACFFFRSANSKDGEEGPLPIELDPNSQLHIALQSNRPAKNGLNPCDSNGQKTISMTVIMPRVYRIGSKPWTSERYVVIRNKCGVRGGGGAII